MEFPFVEVLEIGGWCRDCTHAARRLTRFSGPVHYYSANHPRWSGWQEFHLRPPGPKPGAPKTELHSEKMADPKGVAPSTLPQTTGRSAN